jgi:hypothetical protein
MKSKFESYPYSYVLDFPTRRSAHGRLRSEKPLWKCKPEPKRLIFRAIFYCMTVGSFILGIATILKYFFYSGNSFWVPFLGILTLASGLTATVLGISYSFAIRLVGKRRAMYRKPLALDDFISVGSIPTTCDRNHVQIIRETIATVYGVSVDIVYPEDTPESLRKLGCLITPFGFEVVLRVFKKVDVHLADSQIDSMNIEVYNRASSVADVVQIMCAKLSAINRTRSAITVNVDNKKTKN